MMFFAKNAEEVNEAPGWLRADGNPGQKELAG
jgi:hypothetical protein